MKPPKKKPINLKAAMMKFEGSPADMKKDKAEAKKIMKKTPKKK
jgi:hypothetical protein